jgi:hypothetical protein
MPTYFAQVTYTGNGSTTSYAIPFSYIDSSHVKAYINGTLTSAFTVSTSTLTFTSAPANGATVRIERQTPIDARLVDFADGSVLTEADLDRSANQTFYIAQEVADDQINNLALDTDDKYNANSKIIKNVANPVNANDAVNKTYLENTWLSTADKATLTNLNSNIASVNAVNSALANVNTVASDLNEAVSEINTVAVSIANVDTVGTNIANVNIVAGNNANINTVASNNSNITAVANNSTNINAVNANSANINAVNANSSNINTVATNISKVNTLYTEIAKVVEVANDLQEAVSEIDTVATAITNVNNVGNSISNVNTVASNIANVNSFFQQYKVSSTQPSTPSTGDLWYDTATSRLKIYTGSAWNLASDYLENLINEYTYNITGTPSTVSGVDANSRTFSYTVDSQVNIFLNGVRLVPITNYSLSGGNTITFSPALQNGDVVFAQVFTKLTVAQEALLDQKVANATTQVGLATTQATNSANSATASQASRVASESARDLSQTYRDNAQTYATNSANSATASANSATASSNSATSAQSSLNTFNSKFISSATAPVSPSEGNLWYDTVNVRLKIYIAGSGWQNAGAYLEGLISRYTYTATSGQTVFSVSDNSSVLNFTAEANVFVFLNGVRLTPTSDYTLSGTNTCTLPSGVQVGDTLYIEVITKISLTEEGILQGYVASALADKNTATTQAGIATTQAGIATTQATTSTNQATTATTQAGISTTQAGISTAQAVISTTQAGIATTQATNASTSATLANDWANKTTGTVASGEFSAKYYAQLAQQSAGGGTVKITNTDTTADVLNNKLVAGNGITFTTLNAGANEDLRIALSMTESNATPTEGQTTFSINYTVGFIQVFLNGSKLINGQDFTATNGTTIVLALGATTSDVIEFVKFA